VEIVKRHRNVTFAIEVMFINKIPFITKKSIHLGTAELVMDIKYYIVHQTGSKT